MVITTAKLFMFSNRVIVFYMSFPEFIQVILLKSLQTFLSNGAGFH